MKVLAQSTQVVIQAVTMAALCMLGASAMAEKQAESTSAPAKPKAEVAAKAEGAVHSTPHQVVDDVTERLMKIVDNNKESIKDEPQKYYKEVRSIMEEAVDFNYIARNVMGVKYWKTATDEQRSRFIEVFTSGLVETYAKGMANFAEFEISVLPPKKPVGEARKVEVMQKFKGPNGINMVSYTMGKHRSGNWKLLNVVLDGVNLGKTLRSQFSQSVTESKGDLDVAINGWKWSS